MPTGRLFDPSLHRGDAAVPASGRVRRSARRSGIVLVTSLTMLGLVPAVGQADPAPTIAEVTAQVDALYVEMTAAVEDFDEANMLADEARGNLETLQSNLDRLQADLDGASDQAGALAAAQYQSAGLDPTVQMLFSGDDAGDFLTRMSQLDRVADRQAQTVANLATAKEKLAEQELAVERETTRLDELTASLETAKVEIAAKRQAAEDLLAELTEAERARLAAEEAARAAAAAAAAAAALAASAQTVLDGGSTDSQPTDSQPTDSQPTDSQTTDPQPPVGTEPASGRAQVAIDFAMAQIGDRYVYGAAGPDAWDCSGLMMGAWAAAGVSLPHSSRGQASMGTPVSRSELKPGDLVFFYSPISHVGMYVGNGMVVHASNPSKPVGVAPLDYMPFTTARRVG